jgi:hypothetical protein
MCCSFQGVPVGRLKRPQMALRPVIFKWRQTEPALIAVRWYLRYSLSLRDVEELLEERGLEARARPLVDKLRYRRVPAEVFRNQVSTCL